jgi:thioredoxin reductase (NADPH)
VYAASDGLSVAVFDARAPGGQAGASMRIENYLGFPTGITGQALAARAFVQAQKFGAQFAIPARVRSLGCHAAPFELRFEDGRHVRCRTVVIATGAAYRKPQIDGLERFAGRGTYFWASPVEAEICKDKPVVLVGGGNSAGQAVVYLAPRVAHVHLLVRGTDLAASMSHYLIERIRALDNVTVHLGTEVAALDEENDRVTAVRCRAPHGTQVLKTSHLFFFTGATPNTGWLTGSGVATDTHGFVLTGHALDGHADASLHTPLETSVPGIFAIGDVRAGSIKRVAAAAGEGAAVVASIHHYLAARQEARAA